MNDSGKQGQFVNREQLDAIISNRLSNFRARAWEDDISKNSIDCEPFHNLAASASDLVKDIERSEIGGVTVDQIREYAARDTMPIPCADDREGYSARNDCRYWITGLRDYVKVMKVLKRHSQNVQRYFEFGSATGRVLRHFVAQSPILEFWCSDLNARHIRWICEFMPGNVKPIANHGIPSLPIPDHYFDLITAFSVFTHIDTFETCWLAELKRIMRPGSIAYVTIHNEDTWSRLQAEIENEHDRLVQSLMAIDPDMKEKFAGPMPEGKTIYRLTHLGPYRAQIFHSNQYIHDVWGRFMDILEILPCHHSRQSVVIMRAV